MAIGYLIVQVRIANDAIPVKGATVQIKDDQNNLLYELTTDESGDTKKVFLETVDKNLSLNANYDGEPYVSYNLEATAPGFNALRISGIHIFDGETAYQPVTLIPMTQRQKTKTVNQISIGEHAVQMDTVRNQEGYFLDPLILRQVIIPNPITVHLGAPSSSDTNVQVSFTDYVKNVASSEIYPTWPQSSLEANIYAIITFALNRVFTEWYRNRGYNFDITNSTAYDQYFVYGRTTYESINKIVDRIFNQYVIRKGNIVPYFTSFCNGTTVSCQGLSQWGTVKLSNQGLNALQILQYYYSNDIEITETNIITGIVESYPGTLLRFGNRGLDVQTIQTYLNRIAKNYPAIPSISNTSGIFGNDTQKAVLEFQNIFGLTPDGIVGKATWNKISSIYTAVTKLSELESEGKVLGIGTVPPNTVIKLGSSGNDVITLQYILNLLSEYYPTILQVPQTGKFDNLTYQGVIAFQRMMNLSADGIVGAMTWNSLYETYLGILGNVPEIEQQPEIIQYVVTPGDTLWILARRYETTVDEIKRLNNLNSNELSIGQILKIPSQNANSNFNYVVQSGDTLWLIARKFNTSLSEIKRLNNLTSDALSIGQIIKIPV